MQFKGGALPVRREEPFWQPVLTLPFIGWSVLGDAGAGLCPTVLGSWLTTRTPILDRALGSYLRFAVATKSSQLHH